MAGERAGRSRMLAHFVPAAARLNGSNGNEESVILAAAAHRNRVMAGEGENQYPPRASGAANSWRHISENAACVSAEWQPAATYRMAAEIAHRKRKE